MINPGTTTVTLLFLTYESYEHEAETAVPMLPVILHGCLGHISADDALLLCLAVPFRSFCFVLVQSHCHAAPSSAVPNMQHGRTSYRHMQPAKASKPKQITAKVATAGAVMQVMNQSL